MEINKQVPTAPEDVGTVVYAIENLIEPHIPHIPPASYKMAVEEFMYYKKLYQFRRFLDEIVPIFKESLPKAKAEPGIEVGPAIENKVTVEPELSDNCWVLVSPDGQRHVVENLQEWARENFALLGFQSAEDWKVICKRMRNVARQTVFGKSGPKTFRGWTVEQRPKEKISNTAHMWTLVSPAGEVIQVYNLRK